MSLDQQIADNAQAATGARLVHFAWLDASSREVRVGAMSGPHPEVVQQALAAAQRFVPHFDPLVHVRFPVDVNRWNASVYSGGGPLLTTFEQIVEGSVSPAVAGIARRVAGLRYTFTCPLQQDDQVIGSLAFHFARLPTEAQQRTCEAFARQASLTLENAQLREQTARVLAAVSEGIVETDTSSRVIFVNPAAASLFGRGPSELLGQLLADLIEAIGGSAGVVSQPDGTRIPIDYTSTALPSGEVLVLRDSRARIEAERNRDALARAERLRALGQMASGIAHNLNQALALISGYAQLASDELEHASFASDKLRGHLEVVASAAYDSAQAVRRLLSFARTSQVASFGPVDACPLREDVAQLTAPRWRDLTQTEGRPVELVVHASQPAILEGDPASLREAVRNLVFNSVDALVAGGTIALRASSTPTEVTLEVADTGPGIPPDVRPRIFDPFFTTKGEGGTGLGLAQVMATVEQHHGRLDLESGPDQGTTFRLVFPAAHRQPVDSRLALAAAPAQAGRALRILAVDDEERLARLIAHVLSASGHRVSVATSGEEALELIAHEPFDLVISDLGMGAGMNGWELAERVRTRHPSIRVILATGWGAAITDQEAAAHYVAAVVAKPYTPAELRALVARLSSAARVPPPSSA